MNREHSAATWQTLPCRSEDKQTRSLNKKTELIRLEINANKLRQLLNTGALCAADFRCLDCKSKQCIWQICLAGCIHLESKKSASLQNSPLPAIVKKD